MGNSQGKDAPPANPLSVDEENPYVKKILEARNKLTGMERLKLMFTLDEYGGVSPEVQRIIHTMCFSMIVGGLIGAIGRGRIAHMNFMRSNAHEAFETPLAAKRKLQDTVTLGMGSGAFRIGWRVTLFTTTYMSVATMVSTYRGKMGILDQVAGAGLAGFIYKFPQGPKAQIAGTAVGSLLGLTAGIITMGLTKLTGETIDTANLRYYQYLSNKEAQTSETTRAQMLFTRSIEKGITLTEMESEEFQALTNFHEELLSKLDVNVNIGSTTPSTNQNPNVDVPISSQSVVSSENSKSQQKSVVSSVNAVESRATNDLLASNITSKNNNSSTLSSASTPVGKS